MVRTDYARLAAAYDASEIRHDIPRDTCLEALLSRAAGRPLRVLDLACGTGNYLRTQRVHFADADITWVGADAEQAMLAQARPKLPGVELHVARAEALPFADGAFDYVSCTYAFHHFEPKERALDELVRVLAPGGTLRLVNVVPAMMERGWVSAFFPSAALEDQKRFWSPQLLAYELERRGLQTALHIDYSLRRVPAQGALEEAERRTFSALCIIPEAHYQEGLARLRQAASQPQGTVTEELARMTCTAVR